MSSLAKVKRKREGTSLTDTTTYSEASTQIATGPYYLCSVNMWYVENASILDRDISYWYLVKQRLSIFLSECRFEVSKDRNNVAIKTIPDSDANLKQKIWLTLSRLGLNPFCFLRILLQFTGSDRERWPKQVTLPWELSDWNLCGYDK